MGRQMHTGRACPYSNGFPQQIAYCSTSNDQFPKYVVGLGWFNSLSDTEAASQVQFTRFWLFSLSKFAAQSGVVVCNEFGRKVPPETGLAGPARAAVSTPQRSHLFRQPRKSLGSLGPQPLHVLRISGPCLAARTLWGQGFPPPRKLVSATWMIILVSRSPPLLQPLLQLGVGLVTLVILDPLTSPNTYTTSACTGAQGMCRHA